MGGETCAVNPPRDDCASAGGGADADMAFAHYSFLNQSYNANVNNDWVAQGCIENIKRQLGYRLQLVSGPFSHRGPTGTGNSAVAAISEPWLCRAVQPRGLELVLRHTVTGRKFFAALVPRHRCAAVVARHEPGSGRATLTAGGFAARRLRSASESARPRAHALRDDPLLRAAGEFQRSLQHRHGARGCVGTCHRLPPPPPYIDRQRRRNQCNRPMARRSRCLISLPWPKLTTLGKPATFRPIPPPAHRRATRSPNGRPNLVEIRGRFKSKLCRFRQLSRGFFRCECFLPVRPKRPGWE